MSNGTIDNVKTVAAKFLEDLKADNLAKLYQTKNY
jgi:hypothetical protein